MYNEKCIFYSNKYKRHPRIQCSALTKIDCDNCPFYKSKDDYIITKKGYTVAINNNTKEMR